MKSNKLLETIAIFNTLERKRFRNVIKNKKRDSLNTLLELCFSKLDKNQALPDKEAVYILLFGKKYKKENDFLLRNEYRLLTDEAEEFIRLNEVWQLFPGLCEAARLKKIYDSGDKVLFKKEYDSLFSKYENDIHFRMAADPLFLDYFISSNQVTVNHFKEVTQKIIDAKTQLNVLYNRYLSDYEVRLAFSDKVNSVLTKEPLIERISATLETDKQDQLVMYRALKMRSYYKSGEEKVNILIEAEKLLKQTHDIPELGSNELFWLLSTIGLEYYLNYDFEKAAIYYQKVFSNKEVESFNRLPEAALNYMSALMSNDRFDLAVKAIIPFEERMAASTAVFYKYICLKAQALLFLNSPAAARKELNRMENHSSSDDFLYWRITLILSFAIENRWEEAQNEYKNVLKTKTIRETKRIDIENLKSILDALLKIGMNLESGKKPNQSQLQSVTEKTNEMVKNPGDFLYPPKLILSLLKKLN